MRSNSSQTKTNDRCADEGPQPRSPRPQRIRRGSLIHYSDEPLPPLRAMPQKESDPDGYRSRYAKPIGLWVSVLGRGDWASWCRCEHFRRTRQQHATLIELEPDARVLRLSCATDLDIFTRDYGTDVEWSTTPRWVDRVIEWEHVAADWQGIIIAPYIGERRLHDETGWYYGWDCASGCIWDPTAVAATRLLRVAAPKASPHRSNDLAGDEQ